MHFFDMEWQSNRQKVARTWCAVYMFISKRALRHNGMHFFNISTSKSRPNMACFLHFYFNMCFARQQRAGFQTSRLPNRGGPLWRLRFLMQILDPILGVRRWLIFQRWHQLVLKRVIPHPQDCSNHPLKLQNTLLKSCAGGLELQSRKAQVCLHASNIHVSRC